jgi:hypothetical protein
MALSAFVVFVLFDVIKTTTIIYSKYYGRISKTNLEIQFPFERTLRKPVLMLTFLMTEQENTKERI